MRGARCCARPPVLAKSAVPSHHAGVPPERLRALRTAFRALLEDADFLAACERRKLIVDGASGEDIDEIVRETLRLPQSVANKVAQIMQ